ncbi:MAG: hypothetical protein WAN86_02770, partial [Hyphomicrobiaceae bacterium]
RLVGRWAPAAVACVVLAMQAVAYQGVLSTAGGVSGFVQILTMTGLTCLFLYYAVFSMGRSLGLRWRRKRR